MRRLAFTAAALLLVFGSGQALAQSGDNLNRVVEVINETPMTIVQFYASNVGTNDWQEDILGTDVLPPGESVTINIDDGTGYCKYDFKAVADDGREAIQSDVNVCAIASFSFVGN